MFNKKVLTSLLISSLTIFNMFACWFTEDNFDKTYIAGVNYFFNHFNGATIFNQAVYYNNMSVNLPLTVWVKIEPQVVQQNQNNVTYYKIKKAKLYYKVINSTSTGWHLAKSIIKSENAKWDLDFSAPVKLFGDSVITKKMITNNGDEINAGDKIVLVLWLQSDLCKNGNQPNASLPSINPEGNTADSSTTYDGYFKPAYVMSVIYNGRNIKIGR